MDGIETKLTDLSVPEKPKAEIFDLEQHPLVIEALVTLAQINKIQEITEKGLDDVVSIDVTDATKEQRSVIHQSLKKIFRQKIVASTKDSENNKKIIEVRKFDSKKKDRLDWEWPAEYVHFVLYKENIDTVQAINALASKTGLKPAFFAYAGTKDKRAKTSQWVSVRQVDPFRLANGAKRIPNIFIGNILFKKEPLKLGQLQGNRFRIVLRNVSAEDDVITKTLETFKDKGFINYFGHQRFGNCASIPTYQIGKALLKQQWKEACELIMKPRGGEPRDVQQMREHWWKNRDSKVARKMLHPSCTFVEAKLLDGFIKNGETDYMGALNNVARNMRLLYLHAYQSIIWNKLASKRVKEKGLELCIGDLVYVDKDNIEPEVIEDPDNLELDDSKDDNTSYFKNLVKPITVEDISNETYTINDIVLPLPGHDITYPSNETSVWCENFLAEDDLSSESLKQKHKIYSLAGAYRKLFNKAIEFQWCIKKYEKSDDNLIQSDLESIKKVEPIDNGGLYKAVVLDFQLPSATYATMALREMLKCDTSPAAQIASEKASQLIELSKSEELSPKKPKLDLID